MPQGYYCEKCYKFILVVSRMFHHPHLGERTYLACNKCGGMVYLKTQEVKI